MTNNIKMLAIAGLISMGTALFAFTPSNETCKKGSAACEPKCELKGSPDCPLKDVPKCCKK